MHLCRLSSRYHTKLVPRSTLVVLIFWIAIGRGARDEKKNGSQYKIIPAAASAYQKAVFGSKFYINSSQAFTGTLSCGLVLSLRLLRQGGLRHGACYRRFENPNLPSRLPTTSLYHISGIRHSPIHVQSLLIDPCRSLLCYGVKATVLGNNIENYCEKNLLTLIKVLCKATRFDDALPARNILFKHFVLSVAANVLCHSYPSGLPSKVL